MDAGVSGQAECVCVYSPIWFIGCNEKGWSQWMQMFQDKFSACTIQYGSLVVTKRGGASGCRCSRTSLVCIQSNMVHWL